ncbi:MAG TPA: DUF2125 domain-containing protein [Caulobacteraceae bacterium]|jgi:hypothetical protein
MPDLPSPRKPPSRFWLYGPYVLLVVAIIAWSVVWMVVSRAATSRMDQAAASLRAQGWTVDWASRRVGGYPFRLNIRLQAPHIAEPSGWSLAAPALEAEAYAYAPGHWVMVAPQGVTLIRPNLGAVVIAGEALRASVTRTGDQPIPQIAIEGWKLTAAPQIGARPLPIASADRFALYLRPLAGDRAEFQLQLAGAAPVAGGLLARLSADRPLNLVWDETVSHAAALGGRDWPSAVRRWSGAGGGLSLTHGELSAGGVTLNAQSGQMVVGADGYLTGKVALDLSHAESGALGEIAPDLPLVSTDLTFRGGKTLLGPFVVGKATKVY